MCICAGKDVPLQRKTMLIVPLWLRNFELTDHEKALIHINYHLLDRALGGYRSAMPHFLCVSLAERQL